jgi:putative endonuclease
MSYSFKFHQTISNHLSGSIHTRQHRPWELIMFMGFKDKLKATAFEKYLKSGAGRAFAKKRFW